MADFPEVGHRANTQRNRVRLRVALEVRGDPPDDERGGLDSGVAIRGETFWHSIGVRVAVATGVVTAPSRNRDQEACSGVAFRAWPTRTIRGPP